MVVDPDTELAFLHDLPVELMWGVGPVTQARLAEIGVLTIGQLARLPGQSLARLLGPAAGEKLSSLALNRDPREIKMTAGPARREHSRRSARGLPKRTFFDPRCGISLKNWRDGCGRNQGLVGL